jgi:AraC-like DNA-binding protein
MSLSIRSLQRELRAQQLSYQELVRRHRLRQAKVLLREKRPVIKDVAYRLGFKDVGSFRRAFHSWTGKSVGAWLRDQSSSSTVSTERGSEPTFRLMAPSQRLA